MTFLQTLMSAFINLVVMESVKTMSVDIRAIVHKAMKEKTVKMVRVLGLSIVVKNCSYKFDFLPLSKFVIFICDQNTFLN